MFYYDQWKLGLLSSVETWSTMISEACSIMSSLATAVVLGSGRGVGEGGRVGGEGGRAGPGRASAEGLINATA